MVRFGLGIGLAMGCGVGSDPLVFVFAGESNAGGQAVNASASAAELAARPSVQILNNTSLEFESLDVGTNNLIDHFGLTDNATHGMEIGLANEVDAGSFPGRSTVYLVKTGQGGSTIGEWDDGDPYWDTFLERIAAAKELLGESVRWVVWYSQGINDAIAGTAAATWKAATVAHLAKIQTELPGCVVVMTEFQGLSNGSYTTQIREIAAADAAVSSVDLTGAATDGGNHWSYAGFKNTVVPAMVAATLALGVR